MTAVEPFAIEVPDEVTRQRAMSRRKCHPVVRSAARGRLERGHRPELSQGAVPLLAP